MLKAVKPLKRLVQLQQRKQGTSLYWANPPDVIDAVLVCLHQGLDVCGGDGIKEQDLSLLTSHSQHRPAGQERFSSSLRVDIQGPAVPSDLCIACVYSACHWLTK